MKKEKEEKDKEKNKEAEKEAKKEKKRVSYIFCRKLIMNHEG